MTQGLHPMGISNVKFTVFDFYHLTHTLIMLTMMTHSSYVYIIQVKCNQCSHLPKTLFLKGCSAIGSFRLLVLLSHLQTQHWTAKSQHPLFNNGCLLTTMFLYFISTDVKFCENAFSLETWFSLNFQLDVRNLTLGLQELIKESFLVILVYNT